MTDEPSKEASEHTWVPMPPEAAPDASEAEAPADSEPDGSATASSPSASEAEASSAPEPVEEPAPIAPEPGAGEPEPVAPAPEPIAPAPEPIAPAPEPLATQPDPAAAAPPLTPEPASAAALSWEPPLADSDSVSRQSGSDRPELVLLAGFVAGFLVARLLQRLAS